MRKWICFLLALAAIGFGVLPMLHSQAVTPLETDRACSLTLHYTQNDTAFAGLNIGIYRVAEAFPDGTFALTGACSEYPVNIYDITSQPEWKDVAHTLIAYLTADGIEPDRIASTDEAGTAVFSELETGMYLIRGQIARGENGTYLFDDFLVYLPTPDDAGYRYDVEAKPKCSNYTAHTEYRVIKLWNDSGHALNRPESVTVEILKDGVWQETVELGPDNDWCYVWQDPEGTGIWTVTERNVPEGYHVTVSESETVFVITNTHSALTGEIPETGDTSSLWLYIMMMCGSGFALVILGTMGRRGNRNEEKK